MTLVLGADPIPLAVHLSAGARFAMSLRTLDGTPWPDGTTAALEFFADQLSGSPSLAHWPATVSGSLITWSVPGTDVAALLAQVPTWARLWYAGDVLWAEGRLP